MNFMSKYRSMLILGVLASLGVVWFIAGNTVLPGSGRAQEASPQQVDAASGETTTTTERADETSANPVRSADTPILPIKNLLPLPDNRLPLAQQLDALKARVQQGDPVAACRLAIDALRCRATARVEQFQSEVAASMARRKHRGGDDFMLGMLANSAEQSDASSRFCKGVDAAMIPDIDQLPERAINAMSVRQKVLMAMSQTNGAVARLPKAIEIPPGTGNSTKMIQPQFLADHAFEFLQQGVANADPLALEGMLMVYVPVWIPGTEHSPRLSSPNPRRFAIHALTMRQVYGDEALGGVATDVLGEVMQKMTAEQIAALQSEADREVLRWKSVTAARGRELTADVSVDDTQLCLE
jgi:hypothetical protein